MGKEKAVPACIDQYSQILPISLKEVANFPSQISRQFILPQVQW